MFTSSEVVELYQYGQRVGLFVDEHAAQLYVGNIDWPGCVVRRAHHFCVFVVDVYSSVMQDVVEQHICASLDVAQRRHAMCLANRRERDHDVKAIRVQEVEM